MKKRYLLLLSVFAIEFFCISILQKNNISVQSWVGNAIGIFVFLLPIQILLLLLSKDSNISKRNQMFCKVVFWFISICYTLGGIASLL